MSQFLLLFSDETGVTESKWDWSPINRKFYNIEFVSDRDTFKPAGWTREWPDKQTLERNLYEGAVKVYQFSVEPRSKDNLGNKY